MVDEMPGGKTVIIQFERKKPWLFGGSKSAL